MESKEMHIMNQTELTYISVYAFTNIQTVLIEFIPLCENSGSLMHYNRL